MKKLVLFSLLVFCFVLPSCRGQKYGILSYQDSDIYAECLLNGEYKIAVTKSGDGKSVSFLSPESLSSVSFTERDGKIVGRAGETEIPFDSQDLSGVLAILSMFSLNEGELVSATGEGESACMEFNNTLGTYKITIGKNNLPRRIEILSNGYTFDILVEAIKLN